LPFGFVLVLLQWATDSTKDSHRQRQAVAGVVQIVTLCYTAFFHYPHYNTNIKSVNTKQAFKSLAQKTHKCVFCGLDSFFNVGVLRLIAEKNSPICPCFVCYN
jgi:hypothetical protein